MVCVGVLADDGPIHESEKASHGLSLCVAAIGLLLTLGALAGPRLTRSSLSTAVGMAVLRATREVYSP